MFQEITYFLIFGIPFIVYLGIIPIVMFIITAFLKRKGKIKISIQWHYRFAYISIILALIHGFLGVSAYF